MKELDAQAYLGSLKELALAGKEVRLTITGSSMAPFLIHARDSILFSKPNRELRRGDMVFFQRTDGTYVMHRILRVKPEGLYIIGDGQTQVEGPVQPGQVFGLVSQVCRKGKWIRPGDFWWGFFSSVWLWVIPFRRVILTLGRIGTYVLRPFRKSGC